MNNNKINVTYLSPGWPLRSCPNGIVTYIQNLISGFNEQVIPTIMTNNLEMGYFDKSVIDLSQFNKNVNYLIKLCDKVLWTEVTNKYIENKCWEYKIQNNTQFIVDAINSLDKKIDILEVEESFGFSGFLVKEINVPIVTRLHGPWFIHAPIMKLDKKNDYQYRVNAEGNAIKISQGVTAPSLDVLDKVRNYYDCLLPDAQVIPNPVLPVLVEEQWQYRPESKPTVLVVGRFDLHKGGDIAIEAFRVVASVNDEVELLFVGPDRGIIVNDKAYTFASYMDAFIPEIPIKKRIQFLGHCDGVRIAKLRQSSTLTIVPSRYDNFPITLLEALSAGSPVVAMDVGGMKEIITNDFNGLLAEPESAESLADNILKLLDDPEKMQRLSRNAITDSQKRFSPVTVAKQTEVYYRSIITS